MKKLAALLAVLLAALGRHGRADADEARSLVSPNLAEVVTATYLGTGGTEWLSCGGFLPDGTILVCGVSLEGDLALRGVKAEVLGRDAPALAPPKGWPLISEMSTGKVALPTLEGIGVGRKPEEHEPFSLEPRPTEKEIKQKEQKQLEALRSWPRPLQWGEEGETVETQTMYRKLCWFQSEATGFLAVFSPDLKTVLKLRRLPRGAGSITSAAVAADGAVYIAGAATDRIAGLSDRPKAETVEDPKGVSGGTFGCRQTFLARLSADLSRVEWVRDVAGWSIAPRLRVLKDGMISLHGPGLRTYSPAGECLRAVSLENTRVVSGLDVSPLDGRYTRVGDWMSGTGREPYRNPRLYVYNPDGTVYKHLYGWRGPFVGVDDLRLVGDSAVRRSAYDADGNLVVSTWSHGGNNVFFRYPYDIERWVPNRLGHQPMMTCASVIKMGRDHNVVASTRWLNAAFIRDLACAADGSVVLVGQSGSTVRLPNSLSDLSGGTGIYVIDPDLTAYRFTTLVPACGTRVAVGGCYDMPNAWGFASGFSKGRPMLLCLTGAVPAEKEGAGTASPPLKDPVQARFGGGLMDGYAILLDLTASRPWPPYVEPERPERPPRPYDGPALAWPAEGQVFHFGTERYVTVKATFRDAKEAMWPSFYQGRGAPGGTFAYGAEKAAAAFVLDCPDVVQEAGVQTQRVCGELVSFTVREETDSRGRPRQVADLNNKVRFTATASSAWQPEADVARYATRTYPKARCTLDGELAVGPRRAPVRGAECSAVFLVPRGIDGSKPGTRPNEAYLVIRFTVPGGAIGLGGGLAGQAIRVQFTCAAACTVDYSAHQEKIELPTLELPSTFPRDEEP